MIPIDPHDALLVAREHARSLREEHAGRRLRLAFPCPFRAAARRLAARRSSATLAHRGV